MCATIVQTLYTSLQYGALHGSLMSPLVCKSWQ